MRALLLAVLLLAPVALAAGPRVETRAYGPAPFVACGTEIAAGRHDAACFDVRPGDARASIRVRDATGLSVGWSYSQIAEDGISVLASGQLCGARSFDLVDGAARLMVRVVNLAQNAAFYCGPLANGTPGTATQGTIEATFLG